MNDINKEKWKLLIEKLREWKEQQGFTTEQIAENTGYRADTIDRVMNSKFPPKLDVLHNICKAMDVELNISTKIEGKYRVYRDKGKIYVERIEAPRFRAEYINNGLDEPLWIDDEPHARDYIKVANMLREASDSIVLFLDARQ